MQIDEVDKLACRLDQAKPPKVTTAVENEPGIEAPPVADDRMPAGSGLVGAIE